MQNGKLQSDFLRYLVQHPSTPGDRLPPLNDIGTEMGVSVGKLREELAVARGLGFVTVRPRLGIQREMFDFSQVVLPGVLYGLATGEADFTQFSKLRQTLEANFWNEAVQLLTLEDKATLQTLVRQAWAKLHGNPIHIPKDEHRFLHLTIFGRLQNPFVQGLLVAYWDAYDAGELTRYMGYDYWLRVWQYHERIIEALCQNEYALGQQLLIEHFKLLPSIPEAHPDQVVGD
jgi:DNA-binding FadR family transcriptional regulator